MENNYKTTFKYKEVHQCEAVVLACIDFRFWRETMEFVEKRLEIKSYDFAKIPGAVKGINELNSIALQSISVPCDLHHAQKIVLVNHSDCGAYGGSKVFEDKIETEQKHHESELRKAKTIINWKYPQLEVVMVYAKLVDNGDNIEFVIVE